MVEWTGPESSTQTPVGRASAKSYAGVMLAFACDYGQKAEMGFLLSRTIACIAVDIYQTQTMILMSEMLQVTDFYNFNYPRGRATSSVSSTKVDAGGLSKIPGQ